jgi:signal transduction histidine kinase
MKELRAIIIEDSRDDADLLLYELRRNGYEPVTTRVQLAEDFEDALLRETWDIVFSDWSMPRFSAPEALEVLHRNGVDLPFIIVSGTIGEDVAVAALRGGAHDFLPKGNLTRLAPAIERELRETAIRRDRLAMQEQLLISDRMASVGILAAGVAHEINNPLNAVLGNLVLALEDLESMQAEPSEGPRLRQVIEQLRDATESAERIRDIAVDMKLFARAESEERTAVDVRTVVESSLRMARTEIRHRCQVTTSFGDVPLVDANESRLGQVFLNLIVNAAQSMPEGRMDENEIAISTMPGADGRVVVEVRDTGCGIAPEVRKLLFAPFFTTKPVGVGTGLGLSICHRIVSEIGGTITVDSELGRGSAFRVHLQPAATATAPASTTATGAPGSAAHADAPPAHRGSVLVVDDEPMLGVLTRRILEGDHDVATTTSAKEALDWIKEGRRFDLIVCDLMMPHMTGMDLYEELETLAPEQARRMVFLTGGAFTPRGRQFLDAVPNTCLDKPVDIRKLRTLVNERLS